MTGIGRVVVSSSVRSDPATHQQARARSGCRRVSADLQAPWECHVCGIFVVSQLAVTMVKLPAAAKGNHQQRNELSPCLCWLPQPSSVW